VGSGSSTGGGGGEGSSRARASSLAISDSVLACSPGAASGLGDDGGAGAADYVYGAYQNDATVSAERSEGGLGSWDASLVGEDTTTSGTGSDGGSETSSVGCVVSVAEGAPCTLAVLVPT
jgi:hypothetical protein